MRSEAVQGISIAREAGISFLVNTLLSLAFFLALFRDARALLRWEDMAFDFVPQSIAVALMSALVPALIARRRWARSGSGSVPALRPVLRRAAAFAAGGALLGGCLAWLGQGASLPPVGWTSALAMKMIYGGLLGALITTTALREMVR